MSGRLISPVLVGRRTERTELVAALAAAESGTTQFAFIGGEAGIGKSRLVGELIRDAESRGVRVLSGQCVQLGSSGVPFAPLVDALRLLARSIPPAEFDRALGPARRPLLRLLPTVDAPIDDTEGGGPVQVSHLLELVLGVLERLAESGPVLVVIEDLHWADQSTLDLVAYLVRAMRGVPVALVGTFRSDEMNRRHPLRALLVAWTRAPSVSTIDLHRFDRTEVGAQLAAILGRPAEPDLVDAVFERSEGNPFLVEEVFGAVSAGGPGAALPINCLTLAQTTKQRIDPHSRARSIRC